MKKIVIAIDGHSACGKSSTAKKVARHLKYVYIDSGAMYRAVTLYFLEHDINITSAKEINNSLNNINVSFKNSEDGFTETYLNGLNIEKEIRTMRVSNYVSTVSAIPQVRNVMVSLQQKLGNNKGIVMDGRDIGTVVFPEAELKIFMTASVQVRANRRQKELLEKGDIINFGEVVENIQMRDELDSTRKESPLRQAKDAVVVDNSYMTFEEQVNEVVNLAEEKIDSL